MKEISLSEVARAINCKSLLNATGPRSYGNVSTDTRNIQDGDIFVALIGERFDAHDFLEEAVNKGAGALIISKEIQNNFDVPLLVVEDTLQALQALSNYNRMQFNIPVVGITGSNGKTTTKDMLAVVLNQKFNTLKTKGNFNNEIGLPLTLLELNETYSAAVIEMGMRGLGEIELLGHITRPNVAVITNIGETHLERLGTIENIALAKSEILKHLDKKGFAVFNGEDKWVKKIADNFMGRKYLYGFDSDFDCWADELKTTEDKGQTFKVHLNNISKEIFIPVFGKHNILNAMASILVGSQLGLDLENIAQGLRSLKLSSMRLEIIEGQNYKVINDAYNANPSSVKASLQILKDLGKNKRTIAILGDMYELGERTEAGHKEVGEAVAKEKIDILIAVGKLAKYITEGARIAGFPEENLFYAEDKARGIEIMQRIGKKGDVILLKGSRGMKMEEMIQGRI